MTFADAIRTCFRKYATFSGRAPRSEYWWFALFVFLVSLVLSFVDAALFGTGTAEVDASPAQPLTGLFQLAVLIPVLAAGWRRMHDTGRPGWYVLLPMLAALGGLFFLLVGIGGFGLAERAGADAGILAQFAAIFGGTGMLVLVIAQIVLSLLLLWWLTRPSEPAANRYGPPPLEVTQ